MNLKTRIAALISALAYFSVFGAGQAFGATQGQWILSYEGDSTNSFVWDKRAASLVRTLLPASLSPGVLSALGGPPDPVFVVDKRYARVSACKPHECIVKGFLWVDAKTGVGLGARSVPDELVLGSNGFSSENIPSPARQALIDWVTEQNLRPVSVKFVGRSGETKVLDTSAFMPRDRFAAPANGPGFDCAIASGSIEETICNDAELSKLDLALTNLADEIRRGHSTTVARAQLLDLQRAWKKDRDIECASAPEMTSCLRNRYNVQHQRLMNWIPKN